MKKEPNPANKEPEEVSRERLEKWRGLELEGVSRTEIARRYGVSRQLVCQKLGKIEGRGLRKETHVYVIPEAFEKVAKMAAERGLRHNGGDNAGQGSVGKLIESIASGRIELVDVT
jgi:predicted DNA-binding protein (UPF0251 family)